MEERIIITGASEAYEASLLSLIGSLNLNWPDHPRVLVYDLGMTRNTLDLLGKSNIEIRKVPPFCPHWRRHFTWKVWCIKDAPANNYLWLDAGVCLLRPMPEVFEAVDRLGYFCSSNHWELKKTMSKMQQNAIGLSDEELTGMVSINSGIYGLKKDMIGKKFINKALKIAADEKNMMATEPFHRHDQSLYSALFYEFYSPVLFADFNTYAGWKTPEDVINQKIWVHRRHMRLEDQKHFIDHVSLPGLAYIPKPSAEPTKPSFVMKCRIRLAKMRGRTPKRLKAGECIYNGVRD